ncbi:MAG: hypothetical protein R6X34_10690 [Chloroflexota bacterium]
MERLENEVKHFNREIQAAYQKDINALKRELQDLQARFMAMKEGSEEEWLKGRSQLQERIIKFRKYFMETAERIRHEDADKRVELGWLQGFTDERTQESAGWAEGLAGPTEGSEGWAEGMGKQGSESKGWAEGYNRS